MGRARQRGHRAGRLLTTALAGIVVGSVLLGPINVGAAPASSVNAGSVTVGSVSSSSVGRSRSPTVAICRSPWTGPTRAHRTSPSPSAGIRDRAPGRCGVGHGCARGGRPGLSLHRLGDYGRGRDIRRDVRPAPGELEHAGRRPCAGPADRRPSTARDSRTSSGRDGRGALVQAAGACAEALDHRWRYQDGHGSTPRRCSPRPRPPRTSPTHRGASPRTDRPLRRLLWLLVRPGRSPPVPATAAHRGPRLDLPDGRHRPLVPQQLESMPADFDAACSRRAPCAQAPGGSVERIVELLRACWHPLSGIVPGPDGTPTGSRWDSWALSTSSTTRRVTR